MTTGIPMKKALTYFPMWETFHGRVGIGMGYDLKMDALDELKRRNEAITQKDRQQWLKVVTTDYETIEATDGQ